MKRIFNLAFPILFAALFAACSSEENPYSPAQPVADGTPVVYFSNDNPATVIDLEEENPSFSILLERRDSVGELTVPIVVNSQTGDMTVQNSVTFADGEPRASLTVPYTYTPGMSLSVSLGAGYGNPYLIQDGTLTYNCSVSRLKKFADVEYGGASSFALVESSIFNYEGMNQFVFTNFMGSGVNQTFMVDTKHTNAVFDPDNLKKLCGDFTPVDNYYFDGDGWYIVDEANDIYPLWTPSGTEKPIYYFYYYAYANDYSYSYIDFRASTSDASRSRESRFYSAILYRDENLEAYDFETINYTLKYAVKDESKE